MDEGYLTKVVVPPRDQNSSVLIIVIPLMNPLYSPFRAKHFVAPPFRFVKQLTSRLYTRDWQAQECRYPSCILVWVWEGKR